MRSQGDLARPYADFPNREDTPYPPSPSWSPELLWSPSREGTDILISPAHPVLSQKPGKQAQKVMCSPKPGRKPQIRAQVPSPCWAGGCLLSFPSTWPPDGGFSGSSFGAEKGENGLTPDSPCLGHAREAERSGRAVHRNRGPI